MIDNASPPGETVWTMNEFNCDNKHESKQINSNNNNYQIFSWYLNCKDKLSKQQDNILSS